MSLTCFRSLSTASAIALSVVGTMLTSDLAAASDRLASVVDQGSKERAPRLDAAAVSPLPATEESSASLSRAASRPVVTVMVDRAKIVRLPERTQTVIVGNPSIADVTLQKNGIVVLTGKSYGLTNIIALDGTGATLVESTVSVQAPTESIVVVQRGMERESYSCTPRCQPSMLLGDSPKYFGDVSAQAAQRNTAATQR